MRNGAIGKVKSAEKTFSPMSLEPTHPDLYWYGVHGCESLFTVMGTGCQSVKRRTPADGKVEGHRHVGRRPHRHLPAEPTDRTAKATAAKPSARKGESPHRRLRRLPRAALRDREDVPHRRRARGDEETLELYAFMEAADESKRRNGAEVTLAEVIAKARAEVASKP